MWSHTPSVLLHFVIRKVSLLPDTLVKLQNDAKPDCRCLKSQTFQNGQSGAQNKIGPKPVNIQQSRIQNSTQQKPGRKARGRDTKHNDLTVVGSILSIDR